MNILFFLTPKIDVEYLYDDYTIRQALEKIKLKELAHHKINHTVGINDQMENLLQLAVNQNFVPVINDDNIFIGIVTRKAIMQYCYDKLKNAPV